MATSLHQLKECADTSHWVLSHNTVSLWIHNNKKASPCPIQNVKWLRVLCTQFWFSRHSEQMSLFPWLLMRHTALTTGATRLAPVVEHNLTRLETAAAHSFICKESEEGAHHCAEILPVYFMLSPSWHPLLCPRRMDGETRCCVFMLFILREQLTTYDAVNVGLLAWRV